MSERVRVTVAASRCVGSGTCVAIAPELFELDGGVSVPRQVTATLDDDLQDAVDSCPVEAIRLEPAAEGSTDG